MEEKVCVSQPLTITPAFTGTHVHSFLRVAYI